MKQLHLAGLCNTLAGITTAGGRFLFVDLFAHMTTFGYLLRHKVSNLATFTKAYLTIILIWYNCLTACDLSGAKIVLENCLS